MKKLIALLLTAVLALGCAAAFADETIKSSDGNFSVSFQLPEGTTMLSGEWSEDGSIYQANIQGKDHLYFYLAVAAPAKTGEESEETSVVTYNAENGYTDEYIKEMVTELFADDSSDLEIGVQTTAYGTKLAVIRFNDLEAPSLYVFSVWQGYEIGLSAFHVDGEDATMRPITDEQVQQVVDFLSEVWMTVDEAAEAPAA